MKMWWKQTGREQLWWEEKRAAVGIVEKSAGVRELRGNLLEVFVSSRNATSFSAGPLKLRLLTLFLEITWAHV